MCDLCNNNDPEVSKRYIVDTLVCSVCEDHFTEQFNLKQKGGDKND